MASTQPSPPGRKARHCKVPGFLIEKIATDHLFQVAVISGYWFSLL